LTTPVLGQRVTSEARFARVVRARLARAGIPLEQLHRVVVVRKWEKWAVVPRALWLRRLGEAMFYLVEAELLLRAPGEVLLVDEGRLRRVDVGGGT
jgi:hypothetical protein